MSTLVACDESPILICTQQKALILDIVGQSVFRILQPWPLLLNLLANACVMVKNSKRLLEYPQSELRLLFFRVPPFKTSIVRIVRSGHPVYCFRSSYLCSSI